MHRVVLAVPAVLLAALTGASCRGNSGSSAGGGSGGSGGSGGPGADTYVSFTVE